MVRARTEVLIVLVGALVGAVALFALHAFFAIPDFVLLMLAIGVSGIAWFFVEQIKARRKARKDVKRHKYMSSYSVSCDEGGISAIHPEGVSENIAWSDISAVYLQIDEGFLPEPWWVLFSREGRRCSFPLTARGQEEVTNEFEKRLAGYHCKATYREVGNAMVAMNGVYKVWPRSDECGVGVHG